MNVEQTTRTVKMTSALVSDESIFLNESVIRGHHIFKGIWTQRNHHDKNAVALSQWNGGWTCA